MKNLKRIFAVILTAALAVMMLAFNASAAESAKISNTTITIEVGSSYQLYIDRATQSISWSSSDKSIATVSNGKVTAKKAGTATITAKHGKSALKCKVTVVKKGTAKAETKLTVTKTYTTVDEDGKSVFVVEMDFTNNEGKTTSYSSLSYSKAFQNGIECDSCFDYHIADLDNNSKDIKSGATIHVIEMFYIDDNSPVDVLITKFLDGDRVFVDKTFKIK